MKLIKDDKVRVVEGNPELVAALKECGYVESAPKPAVKKTVKKSIKKGDK